MSTIHDNKSRQELFNKPQNNDNYSPAVARDYENNETVSYEITKGGFRVFPNFCMLEIFLDDKGLLRIFYSRGNVVIKGRNLEELVRLLASRKIAVIRATPPSSENDVSPEYDYPFYIDSITFEEN